MVPAGQEPDEALLLGHLLLERLAHDHAGGVLEEVADDDPRLALLEVVQVLRNGGVRSVSRFGKFGKNTK